MSLLSWRLWGQLWPAVAVWLLIALPSLAWSSETLRQSDLWPHLPWWFRAIAWVVRHCWPYSKLARAGATFARWEHERAEARREARCRVCGDSRWDLDHALLHFPGEDDRWQQLWFTPPRFSTQEEADRWLAARAATGEACWE